jgi:hypothetical protein
MKAPEIVTLTPEMAMDLLERNNLNRPLSDQHVARIAKQIIDGKWRFNGDTIKIASTDDVLDGQHRLWAVIEAKHPVDTILVRGLEREAFVTIDTLRKPRSLGDTVALSGQLRHRSVIATALCWLIRWQRKCIPQHREPANRIENSDIEVAFSAHPTIVDAVDRSSKLRSICNPGMLGFFYYVLTNHNEELAERLMHTFADPSGVAVNDPFFMLRAWMLNARGDKHKSNPVETIAVMIKATNAAAEDRKIDRLKWTYQGDRPEPFPVLNARGQAT